MTQGDGLGLLGQLRAESHNGTQSLYWMQCVRIKSCYCISEIENVVSVADEEFCLIAKFIMN